MKRLTLGIIATLVASLFVLSGSAEASATRIDFTGTQTCNYTSFGDMTFPDGNIHVRDAASVCVFVSDTPEVSDSTAYLSSNWNLDSTGHGFVWGGLRTETAADGVISEGIWWGIVTDLLSPAFAATIYSVQQGEGAYEGARLHTTSLCQAGPAGNVCMVSGYILFP